MRTFKRARPGLEPCERSSIKLCTILYDPTVDIYFVAVPEGLVPHLTRELIDFIKEAIEDSCCQARPDLIRQ